MTINTNLRLRRDYPSLNDFANTAMRTYEMPKSAIKAAIKSCPAKEWRILGPSFYQNASGKLLAADIAAALERSIISHQQQ